jgi:putative chitinase
VGSYAGDPQFYIKLIDSVYGNRMGNQPGTHDGSAFIGRGFSQTTGRENYARLAKATGLDLIAHPELLTDPAHFLECGVADFILCGCLPYARADDVLNVTKRLNGGTIGLAERRQWLAKWKAELGSTPIMQAPAGTTPKPLPPDVPKPSPAAAPSITNPSKGSIGAWVKSFFTKGS